MAPDYFNGADRVRPAADGGAVRAGPPRLTRKRPTEQLKHPAAEVAWQASCIPSTGFYNRSTGAWAAFRCGTCPECRLRRARIVRAGFREAAARFGLKDVLTLTLPGEARESTPLENRVQIGKRWNRFRTAVRQWGRRHNLGLLTEYFWVLEAHKDGTPHMHVAVDLEALAIAFGYTGGDRREDAVALANVRAFVAEAWTRAGGGFVWYTRGSRGFDSIQAYRYLAKYLGKAQALRPPWERRVYCTKDDSMRLRPWHRYGASWGVSAVMAKVRIGNGEPDPDHYPGRPKPASPWILARPELRPSGRVVPIPWNPAKGSGIVPACKEAGGHDRTPDWVPGCCHHQREGWPCFCIPPWASEPRWTEPMFTLDEIAEAGDIDRIAEQIAEQIARFERPRVEQEDAGRWSRWGAG